MEMGKGGGSFWRRSKEERGSLMAPGSKPKRRGRRSRPSKEGKEGKSQGAGIELRRKGAGVAAPFTEGEGRG